MKYLKLFEASHPYLKYYYMDSDDGGALFTTETLEEYKKRTTQ